MFAIGKLLKGILCFDLRFLCHLKFVILLIIVRYRSETPS